MSTHIGAAPGAIAKGILLPGDPMRAKYIAENYLEAPECFNQVRGMLGFTGTYKGKRVSVMGTGMGVPSISIYVNELMNEYGVKVAMRIGTCGAMNADVHVKDLIAVEGASTDNDFNHHVFPGTYCPIADFDLLRTAVTKAKGRGVSTHVGQVLTSDTFYQEELLVDRNALWVKYGILAAEMETASLYTFAKKYGVRALTLLTVSDSIVGKEPEMTAQEREKSLDDMITTALETLVEFV